MKKQKLREIKQLLSKAEKANLSEEEITWVQKRRFQIHAGVWHATIVSPTDEDRAMAKQLDPKLNLHVIFINKYVKTT